MTILMHYKYPEWQARMLRQVAEDTLSKTRVFNNSADTWRLGRPEDLGLAEGTYSFSVAPGVIVMIGPVMVPAGQGWTFYGVWWATDLGHSSFYRITVNGVKRMEAPVRFLFSADGYNQKWMFLEQLVYVQENDRVNLIVNNATGSTIVVDMEPEFVVAGKHTQLLVAA